MHVEIWSDVVCPWCAIGKARFEQALSSFPHRDDVRVRWRSFELDPAAPVTPDGPYVERLARKYRTSPAQAQAMIDRMTAQATAEGLDVRFDLARPGNTFDAHRVLHLAADHGVQQQVADRFFRGYLAEGRAIGESAEVADLAVDAGLDEVAVKEVLAGDAYAEAVRRDEQQAAAYGISGVPFFVLDGRFGVSGAQPPSVLRSALEQAWEAREPLAMVGNGASGHDTADHVCEDGTCAM